MKLTVDLNSYFDFTYKISLKIVFYKQIKNKLETAP